MRCAHRTNQTTERPNGPTDRAADRPVCGPSTRACGSVIAAAAFRNWPADNCSLHRRCAGRYAASSPVGCSISDRLSPHTNTTQHTRHNSRNSHIAPLPIWRGATAHLAAIPPARPAAPGRLRGVWHSPLSEVNMSRVFSHNDFALSAATRRPMLVSRVDISPLYSRRSWYMLSGKGASASSGACNGECAAARVRYLPEASPPRGVCHPRHDPS